MHLPVEKSRANLQIYAQTAATQLARRGVEVVALKGFVLTPDGVEPAAVPPTGLVYEARGGCHAVQIDHI